MATVNQLVKQSDAPKQDLVASMFEAQLDQYIKAIGGEKQAIQFMRQAISLCKVNPKLLDCDRNSLLAEIMSAAELKLSLNSRLGQAYLVPFKGKAALIVGYKGYIDLFYRHELSKALYAERVYRNDRFNITLGSDRRIEHIPCIDGDRGDIIGYYAYASTTRGQEQIYFMSHYEMVKFKNSTQNTQFSNFWRDNFDEMALKTVIRRVLTYMPKSIEFMYAMAKDGEVLAPISANQLSTPELIPNRQYDAPQVEHVPAKKQLAPKQAETIQEEDEFAGVPSAEEFQAQQMQTMESTADQIEREAIYASCVKKMEELSILGHSSYAGTKLHDALLALEEASKTIPLDKFLAKETQLQIVIDKLKRQAEAQAQVKQEEF